MAVQLKEQNECKTRFVGLDDCQWLQSLLIVNHLKVHVIPKVRALGIFIIYNHMNACIKYESLFCGIGFTNI